MADSVNNKRNEQSYLRQVQQEKSLRKREIIENQTRDIKAVRDFYAKESKQLEEDSKAAVLQIKEEGRRMAQQSKEERAQKQQMAQEEKMAERERKVQEFKNQSAQRTNRASSSSVSASSAGYNRQAQPVQLNQKAIATNNTPSAQTGEFAVFANGSVEDEASEA